MTTEEREELIEDMCDNYCKHGHLEDEEMIQERCGACPLNKLVQEIKEAIKALDLQVPQSPDITGDGYAPGTDQIVYDTWYCPNCGCSYEYPDDTHDFCPACGQAIRWPQEDS